MPYRLTLIFTWFLLFPQFARSQNCCAPAVPQQGVLGETVTLPYTLELGMHFEYLRSIGLYEGSDQIDDPSDMQTTWKRITLSAAYGLFSRFSISAIMPFIYKEKIRELTGDIELKNTSEGFGDLTVIGRYSILPRDFVNFRELAVGLGVKIPTGATDKRNIGLTLPQELQPGTGSWDFNASLSYYRGMEMFDFVLSGTYLLTTAYNEYKFGNQFSYLLSANFHPLKCLDVTASLAGIVRGKDTENGLAVPTTGRHQLWFAPGIQITLIPDYLRLQIYYEAPLYQHFNGEQLGSDFNLRLSLAGLVSLKNTEEEL